MLSLMLFLTSNPQRLPPMSENPFFPLPVWWPHERLRLWSPKCPKHSQPDPGNGPPNLLLVLDSARSQVLQWGHSSKSACHPGFNHTLNQSVWWPSMSRDTQALCPGVPSVPEVSPHINLQLVCCTVCLFPATLGSSHLLISSLPGVPILLPSVENLLPSSGHDSQSLLRLSSPN